MTGSTWRNTACGIAGEDEANGRIVFAKGMSGLKALADKRWQPVAAAREISPDIRRVLRGQRLRDRIHRTPRPLPRAEVVKLLVNRYTVHPGKCRVETGLTHALLAVAGGAIERDKRAVLGVATSDLGERGIGPGDA